MLLILSPSQIHIAQSGTTKDFIPSQIVISISISPIFLFTNQQSFFANVRLDFTASHTIQFAIAVCMAHSDWVIVFRNMVITPFSTLVTFALLAIANFHFIHRPSHSMRFPHSWQNFCSLNSVFLHTGQRNSLCSVKGLIASCSFSGHHFGLSQCHSPQS